MPEKHYDTDPAKAKSRVLLRDEIKSTLLTFRKPRDLKVICLPGREAREVIEVYDELGIPRENITGFERGEQEYREMIGNANGINAVNGDLFEYARSADSLHFDVNSFDLTENMRNELGAMLGIVAKKLKPKHFLVNVNVLAKRENKKEQESLAARFWYATRIKEFYEDQIGTGNVKIKKRSKIADQLIGEEEISVNLKQLRGDVLTDIVTGTFMRHDDPTTYRNVVAIMGEDKILDFYRVFYSLSGNVLDFVLRNPDSNLAVEALQTHLTSKTGDFVQSELRKHNIELSKEGRTLLVLALLNVITGYSDIVSRNKPYSYISESGAPMIGDIAFVSSDNILYEISRDMMASVGYPEHFLQKFDYKRFEDAMKSFKSRYMNRTQKFNAYREFLGSSYKGPKKKETIIIKEKPYVPTDDEKKEVIKYLREGFPIKEILEVFPRFTDYQLRGYRAGITAGKI